MDELYYEDGQVPDLASSGFTFSDEVIAKARSLSRRRIPITL